MKILITSCSKAHYWYANFIGETKDVIRVCDEYYWAREPAGYINIIEKRDAEIVECTQTKS